MTDLKLPEPSAWASVARDGAVYYLSHDKESVLIVSHGRDRIVTGLHTDEAMRAYATAAVLAERERVRAEVRRNDDGTLDEVVGFGTFHLEQMDAGHWWMQLGPHAVHLQASRGIKAHINENEHGGDDAR